MAFGALFAGHVHPAVRAAVEAQLDDGTLDVTPGELDVDVAELLAARFPLPVWRFTSSGTEATMDGIRLARGPRAAIASSRVEGGCHGHHDEVMISMKPALDSAGPADPPIGVPGTAGITRAAVVADTVVIAYNDPAALDACWPPATSPASSSSRSWRTSAAAYPTPATSRRSARSPSATARC
jgi:glutamate-1-semialdehyde 2,1-aminomutase